jgi:hypothetical protein
MDGRRWRDMGLEARVAQHFSRSAKAEPQPAPKPAASSMFDAVKAHHATLDESELAAREHARARTVAMRQIERALEAENRDAEKMRADSRKAFMDTSALGQMMKG